MRRATAAILRGSSSRATPLARTSRCWSRSIATTSRPLASPKRCAAAIGLAGPNDFLPLTSDRLKAVFGPDRLARTQPIRFVRADAPPLLLLHGIDDTTVSPGNAERLAARVRAAGGRVDLKLYEGIGHVGLMAQLAAPLRAGASVLDDMATFAHGIAASG